ncbi:MAG: hypothetical protein JNM75_02450 [Rhodospirillales bacterium]|nr:hypothetical protein [Rhodospirillales bacterium]
MDLKVVAAPRFEEMAPDERADAARAASRYLLANDFASLDEACEIRGLAMQDLWDEIMAVARLPACAVPLFAFAT